MTDPTMTDLDTFTDAERALAQAIPSAYVTQLAVARCLLRLERLERRDRDADKQLDLTTVYGPKLEPCAKCGQLTQAHDGIGGDQCGDCLARAERETVMASKVAASLPAEPKPQPRRYTAPEALPVGARVRVLDLDPEDPTPNHKAGDIIAVPPSGRDYKVWQNFGADNAHYYFRNARTDQGTWVRTVELVEEEPRHPRGVEAGGEASGCHNCGAPELGTTELCVYCVAHRVTRERDELKARETARFEAVAKGETGYFVKELTLVRQMERAAYDTAVECRIKAEAERDAALARVAELEASLEASQYNARLQGELARMREQAARLDEVSDKAHEELYAVKLERDDANARAERMAAVVHYARLARQTLEAGDDGSPSSGAAVAMVVRARIAPALAALDAAASPVVEQPEEPT